MYIDSRIKFMAKHLTVTINVQFIHYQAMLPYNGKGFHV